MDGCKNKLLFYFDSAICQYAWFSLVPEFCLSCGKTRVATFHPLFEGGLCQTCKVRVDLVLHILKTQHNTTRESGNVVLQHVLTWLLIKVSNNSPRSLHLDTSIVSIDYLKGTKKVPCMYGFHHRSFPSSLHYPVTLFLQQHDTLLRDSGW